MCTIRLFSKNDNSELLDEVIELEGLSINLIDRPAYALYAKDGDADGIIYVFSNDKEEKPRIVLTDIVLEYGANSGRIYKFMTLKEELFPTDLFQIIDKAVKDSSTERFRENLKVFYNVSIQILRYKRNK